MVKRGLEVRPTTEEGPAWSSLTAHQLDALGALMEGSLTMGELCERLAITESAGTALSDRLIAREMVTRESDPSDRRVVRLALTAHAKDIVDRFSELKVGRLAVVFSVLDLDDLAALVRIYEALAAASAG